MGRLLPLLLALVNVHCSFIVHFFEAATFRTFWAFDGLGNLEFHFEQESGVFNEGPEDEEDADDDPGLDGRQPLGLGDVAGDRVEDVDQNQEDGHLIECEDVTNILIFFIPKLPIVFTQYFLVFTK